MEDAILTAKLFCVARRMAHLDIVVYLYRILPTSAMHNRSPYHYKKVIYDKASAALEFQDLLESLPKTHKAYSEACQRLSWFLKVKFLLQMQSHNFLLPVKLLKVIFRFQHLEV